MAVKNLKTFRGFVTFHNLFVFTAVNRDAVFLTRYVKGVGRYTKGVPSVKNGV